MFNYSEIIDISLPMQNGTVVYPGNPEVAIEEIKSSSGTSTISKIVFGSHTGTHIDAPKHVFDGAAGADVYPLEKFIGPCRVLDFTKEVGKIELANLAEQNIQQGERILFKTRNSEWGFENFYNDYIFIAPESAEYLAKQNVSLVGIDYLSVKQRGSKDNRPHTFLLEKNIPIVEGIDLSKVEPGEYQLVLLPLKFMGMDAAPSRAVLMR